MGATTGFLAALGCLIWVTFFIAVYYREPTVNATLPPSEAAYLQACRQEIHVWRDTKAFERRYTFGKDQPEIDIVYTWVNGSDPEHQRGTPILPLSQPEK